VRRAAWGHRTPRQLGPTRHPTPLIDGDEHFEDEVAAARDALEADQVTGEVFISVATGTALGVR
jgi:hypothetical protein